MKILLKKILKKKRNFEIEKNYLWLGCHKKCIKLTKNQSKTINFKLGFYSNGVFDIGRMANDSLLKANLFEASCNLNATESHSISLDEYLNDINDNPSVGLHNSHQSAANPNIGPASQADCATINIFIKNNSNNKYELFKRLNPFTIVVSKD